MAAQLVREWTAIQQFPAATQEKLVNLLAKLKNLVDKFHSLNYWNVNTLTILVMGKGGVGKSSTVNSITGERVVTVSAFQSETPRPVLVSRSRSGFTTLGIVEGGYVSDQVSETIKSSLGRFLLNKTIDALLYVDRLDAYRVDNLDRMIAKAITDSFGREIWQKAIVVLTHAQLSPPDAISYDGFFSRRSESLLKCIHQGTRINKKEIIPTGIPWIPNLVHVITDTALNGKGGLLVDKKLIEGPNANDKGKIFIPAILALQYFVVIKPIQWLIKGDAAKEMNPTWA